MARSKVSEPDREPAVSTPKTTKVTAAAASSTSKKQPSSSKSSKSTAFLLLPLLFLAVAVGYGTLVDSDPSRLADLVRDLPVRFLTSVQDDNALPDKYATDLVNMDVRHVVTSLRCPDASYSPSVLEDGHLVPVTTAMAAETQSDRVFFMLNGRNDGVYVQHNAPFECIGQAAELAAAWLGADRDVMANGVRLYDQMGFPVRTAEDLEASRRIVHVLLDFQLWQWPGIEKGHKYVLEDGVVLTTVALSPKVFDVEYFLTQQESEEIMERGMPGLSRSKVDGSNSSKVVSKSRTSHTAFLPDSFFTRNFRKRAASVARLPSPTFAERLQLLKYDAGEFYRQHFDTFHSREFLPKRANSFSVDDYREWAAWAASTLRSLDVEVPEAFREGGRLFPDADDAVNFPNALLELFHASMTATNMFKALFDEKWDAWILDHVKQNETNVIPQLLEQRPLYLPRIVRAWEDELGLGQLRYTFPKSTPNSVSHFFNWVRWAKERVAFLGDACPPQARPAGALYPKYTVEFQETLLGFLMDDYSRSFVERVTNTEWYEWVLENRGRNHVLFQLMKAFPNAAELAIRAWERRVGDGAGLLAYKMPKYVKHFHPQRYVTLFIYLNNQTKIGGETVFPFALDRFSDEQIERTGMSECSTGLAVPPRGLHASLFYTQTPEGDIDDMSRHGGCPPHEGTKWGSNAFMWDSDADEGADLWTTK